MRTYTVHHTEDDLGAVAATADDVVLVKDGFSWPAFLVPPLWLVFRGLWIALGGYVLAIIAVVVLARVVEVDFSTGFALVFAIHLLTGFEGNDLVRWKLSRRGLHAIAVIRSRSLEGAERRFFERLFEDAGSPPPQPPKRPSTGESPIRSGEVWAQQGRDDEQEIVGLFPRPEGKA